MNFTVLSAHLESKYREILRRIVRLQSGGTIDSLQAIGADTSRQIGASLVSLRQLAASYSPEENLALLLWNSKGREEQIVACMLMPSTINMEKIMQLLPGAMSNEVAEYFGSLFLSTHPDLLIMLEKWKHSEDIPFQLAALTAAARHRMIHKDRSLVSVSMFEELVNRNYSNRYVELVAQRYRFNI